MSETGQRQRAVQGCLNPLDLIEKLFFVQIVNIAFGRTHRADGMRTRRTDANGKNLEKAVIHLEIILNHNIVFDAQFFLDFCNIPRMFTPIRIFINKSFGFFRRFRR